jgi:hypothetical protein
MCIMFEKQTTVTPFVNNLEVELYLKHEIPGSTVWMQYRLSIGTCTLIIESMLQIETKAPLCNYFYACLDT